MPRLPTAARRRPTRRLAICIPARNEAERLPACLAGLAAQTLDARVRSLTICLLANNCTDGTAEGARTTAARLGLACEVLSVTFDPDRAHAGWARRMALQAGARRLRVPADVLLSTDADTTAPAHWVSRTLDYLDAGYDAVAGQPRFTPAERRALPSTLRRRLAAIQGYENATAYLRHSLTFDEPWPRHFSESGASLALTLEMFRRLGEVPAPPLGEDRALLDAVRNVGGRVRHPTDVRVYTSARRGGRAKGGASDSLHRWSTQPDRQAIGGASPVERIMAGVRAPDDDLSFEALPREVERARALVNSLRRRGSWVVPPPEIEPELVVSQSEGG
jgi:cellulose synthase/poly-beta-1,6-N-acetylglucosamine synthase-like glycosyltransferase